jgi:alkanesulfonate monooxygenase SsuD/methylene tetrahydromethanopterin reductase-like flavin-dependent oxidoreductase (luciferase family)
VGKFILISRGANVIVSAADERQLENGSTVQIGICTPQFASWQNLRTHWQDVEALGFDSLWVVDHYVDPFNPSGTWYEGWTLLSALAMHTSRIRIGTLVSTMIYRNPAVLAKQAMTVDQITGGRLELGLGAGSPRDPSHPMTGVPAWEPRERVDRFKEFVEVLDQMLRNETTSYQGNYYRAKEAILNPGPVQKPRPPLLIGCKGKRMLKIAATYADHWNTTVGRRLSPREAVDVTRQRMELLREYAEKQGRDPMSIRCSNCLGFTDENPFASLDALYDFIGRYWRIGISEFMLPYWLPEDDPTGLPIQHISSRSFLGDIATELLPKVKREFVRT